MFQREGRLAGSDSMSCFSLCDFCRFFFQEDNQTEDGPVLFSQSRGQSCSDFVALVTNTLTITTQDLSLVFLEMIYLQRRCQNKCPLLGCWWELVCSSRYFHEFTLCSHFVFCHWPTLLSKISLFWPNGLNRDTLLSHWLRFGLPVRFRQLVAVVHCFFMGWIHPATVWFLQQETREGSRRKCNKAQPTAGLHHKSNECTKPSFAYILNNWHQEKIFL